MKPEDYPHPLYFFLEEDRSFKGLIATVILSAPNNFYHSDAPPEWRLDLDIAFDILRAGADMYCRRRRRLKGEEARLHGILDVALAAYRAGDHQTGVDEVYRFEVAIFGHIENGKRTYEYFPELDTGGYQTPQERQPGPAPKVPTTVVEIAGVGEVANFNDAYAIAKAKYEAGNK
jgi:hypothetical protein